MKAPLIMPTSGLALQQFELQRVDYLSPEAGGRVGGVQAGLPLWAPVWTIGKIGEAKSDEFRAFIMELRGAMRTFYGYDLRRPFPKAYRNGFAGLNRAGGGAFDGSATSWSLAIDANDDCLVTLNGLPVGLTLGTGDYVGFTWSATSTEVAGITWKHKSRVIRSGGGVANGSGVVTVKVEPPIPTAVPGTAVVHLDNPACVMRIIVGSSQLQPIDRRGAVTGGTIAAIQDLRA